MRVSKVSSITFLSNAGFRIYNILIFLKSGQTVLLNRLPSTSLIKEAFSFSAHHRTLQNVLNRSRSSHISCGRKWLSFLPSSGSSWFFSRNYPPFNEVSGGPWNSRPAPRQRRGKFRFFDLFFNNLFYPFKHHLDQLIVGPEMFSANELNIRIKRPGIFYDLRDVL